ncbi:hypothetical protein V8E54_008182 [Elaphomyces granulatus]
MNLFAISLCAAGKVKLRETEQTLLEEELRRERLANDAMETANERIQYILQLNYED